MNKKPLKRNPALIPLSREHHHSLLLCWKIRTGFSNGISAERIKKYTVWFFKNYISSHFQMEEAYVFPILGNDHEMVKKALAQHRRLIRLFNEKNNIEKSLHQLEEELEQHIRFEERFLFAEIQKVATADQLNLAEKMHNHPDFEENQDDLFWE